LLHLLLFAMERSTIFLRTVNPGKPFISIRAISHGKVLVISRG
jgi:nucleoside phosphorylase